MAADRVVLEVDIGYFWKRVQLLHTLDRENFVLCDVKNLKIRETFCDALEADQAVVLKL